MRHRIILEAERIINEATSRGIFLDEAGIITEETYNQIMQNYVFHPKQKKFISSVKGNWICGPHGFFRRLE